MAEVPIAANEGMPTSYLAGKALCLACKHKWVVVAETITAEGHAGDLECPACHIQRGQFQWPFAPSEGEEVWTCGNCEGRYFMLTKGGTFCIGCARHQVFDG